MVQDAGGLLFSGVSILHSAFIFHILCHDPPRVQLLTEAYDTIDPSSQYPDGGFEVFIPSHKAVCNSDSQDTARVNFSLFNNLASLVVWF